MSQTSPIAVLNKPYPFYESPMQALKLCTAIGFFIAVFCFVFEPFGMDQMEYSPKAIAELGYGLVSFLVCAFFMVVLPF